MQKTFYIDEEIIEFRAKYKYYRWINNTLIVLIYASYTFADQYLPPRTNVFGYFKDNAYHYICGINELLSICFVLPCLILILFIYIMILKKVLKEKYVEYVVAFNNSNIKTRKWMITIMAFVFIIAIAVAAIMAYNNLTHITVRDSDIYIHYEKYSVRLDNTYSYDYFTEWSTSRYNYLRLTDPNANKDYFYIHLGSPSKYQDTLLKLLDERTDNKYHLYESAKKQKEK